MSAPYSQLRQIGAAAKTQFQRPHGCPFSVCSAIAMYEEELDRHRETEAKLRESLLRESNLLARKDELILQKDTLSKEFEHRLLNGLQFITSLLAVQSRATKNAEVAAQLTIAANRVATLGRVHRHLHTLDNAEGVEFRQYLEKLCDDLADMASSERPERSLVVEGTELQIPTVTAIPLAFIACELITNSIKYGKGRIVVGLQGTPMGCALSISDDGQGLPQGFNPAATKGLGMKLITALVKQIGGVLDIGKGDRGQGTRFTVRFTAQDSLVVRPPR
jgi:two-component system, sensor histidine kinase PdtaS